MHFSPPNTFPINLQLFQLKACLYSRAENSVDPDKLAS